MHVTTLVRKEEEEKKNPKENPPTNTQTYTNTQGAAGWMDGWTNVELLILPNFSLSPGHSPRERKRKGRGTRSLTL
jgi:hypothetical protein